MHKTITPQVVSAIRRNLVDFGYPTVTDAIVQAQIDKIKAGEKLSIIGMFAETMLRENGYID